MGYAVLPGTLSSLTGSTSELASRSWPVHPNDLLGKARAGMLKPQSSMSGCSKFNSIQCDQFKVQCDQFKVQFKVQCRQGSKKFKVQFNSMSKKFRRLRRRGCTEYRQGTGPPVSSQVCVDRCGRAWVNGDMGNRAARSAAREFF